MYCILQTIYYRLCTRNDLRQIIYFMPCKPILYPNMLYTKNYILHIVYYIRTICDLGYSVYDAMYTMYYVQIFLL